MPAQPPPTPSTRGRLALTGIGKFFDGSTVPALADVSITAEPGEFLVLVGPSGCGKSTLLNVAAGMLRPDAGTVTLDGRPVTAPGPDRAMVFQDHGLFPWLTAQQNVEFGLKMAGVPAAERADRAADALKLVHLSQSAGRLIHQLSGGMRQRIAIARALVMDPAVLLMDEPFAALDAQTRTLLHGQVQDLWVRTRKTVLFVTHSVGEAVRLADRIVVLHAHPAASAGRSASPSPTRGTSTPRRSPSSCPSCGPKSRMKSPVSTPPSPSTPRPRGPARSSGSLARLLIWITLLGTWEAAFRVVGWRAWIFPAPSSIADGLLELLNVQTRFGEPLRRGWPWPDHARHGPPLHVWNSPLVTALGVSGERLAIGFAIGIAIGGVLGAAMWRSKPFDAFVGPLFLGLQTLPSVCWVPLAIIAFKFSEPAIQFVLVMGSFTAFAIALRDGLRNLPRFTAGPA